MVIRRLFPHTFLVTFFWLGQFINLNSFIMESNKNYPSLLTGYSINALKLSFLAICFSLFFNSCSNEELSSSLVEEFDSADLKIGVEFETVDEQLYRLTQKMRRFHNFQVAVAQGWGFDASGYVGQMGHHYVNGSLMDDTFELLKPEALIYIPDGNDGWEFVGVEYLIVGPGPEDPAPDGFIGEEDVWFFNPNVGPQGAWTLHAWVIKENPNGVFAAFNPNIPAVP